MAWADPQASADPAKRGRAGLRLSWPPWQTLDFWSTWTGQTQSCWQNCVIFLGSVPKFQAGCMRALPQKSCISFFTRGVFVCGGGLAGACNTGKQISTPKWFAKAPVSSRHQNHNHSQPKTNEFGFSVMAAESLFERFSLDLHVSFILYRVLRRPRMKSETPCVTCRLALQVPSSKWKDNDEQDMLCNANINVTIRCDTLTSHAIVWRPAYSDLFLSLLRGSEG